MKALTAIFDHSLHYFHLEAHCTAWRGGRICRPRARAREQVSESRAQDRGKHRSHASGYTRQEIPAALVPVKGSNRLSQAKDCCRQLHSCGRPFHVTHLSAATPSSEEGAELHLQPHPGASHPLTRLSSAQAPPMPRCSERALIPAARPWLLIPVRSDSSLCTALLWTAVCSLRGQCQKCEGSGALITRFLPLWNTRAPSTTTNLVAVRLLIYCSLTVRWFSGHLERKK